MFFKSIKEKKREKRWVHDKEATKEKYTARVLQIQGNGIKRLAYFWCKHRKKTYIGVYNNSLIRRNKWDREVVHFENTL